MPEKQSTNPETQLQQQEKYQEIQLTYLETTYSTDVNKEIHLKTVKYSWRHSWNCNSKHHIIQLETTVTVRRLGNKPGNIKNTDGNSKFTEKHSCKQREHC